MRDRLNLTLPVELIGRINELADRKKLPRSAIVEAAVTCLGQVFISWSSLVAIGDTDEPRQPG